MSIVERGRHTLVIAADGRLVRLAGLIGLAIYAAIAIVFGVVSDSPVVAVGLGAFLLAIWLLIVYVHSERWEFDRRSGTATRTKRLLLVVPLRRRWPLSSVKRVEVRERTDSDGDVDREIVLHMVWESVTIAQLGGRYHLDGDAARALAVEIRAAALDSGRPRELVGTESATPG